MSAIPPDQVLPCGCVLRCSIEDGINTMTFIPCRQSCANYRNLLAEAADQGKPVEKRGEA